MTEGYAEDISFTLLTTCKARQIMWGDYLTTLNEVFMEHINRIELQGRIGTVRTNEYNNSRVANFSIATELMYKSKDGTAVNETTWHNIVMWESKDTPRIEEIAVGVPVNVTGRLRSNKYTNAEGTEKIFYEVMAGKVRIVRDENKVQ